MKKTALTVAMCLILGVLLGYVVRGTNKRADRGSRLPKETIAREESGRQTASPPRHHQDDSSKTIDDSTYELDVIFISQDGPLWKGPSTNNGSAMTMGVEAKDDAEFVSWLMAARKSTIIPLTLVLKGDKEAETNNYNKSVAPSATVGQSEVMKEKEPTVGQRVKASIKNASEPNPTVSLVLESVNPPVLDDTGQKHFPQNRTSTTLSLPMKKWLPMCGSISSTVSDGSVTNVACEGKGFVLRLRKR